MDPLVSCVMPTANRRPFVLQAIRRFLGQDYPKKELVILDDGTDSAADIIPSDPQIRYLRLIGKRTLGVKRNECVREARGDLILHWDDDDWMAPHRIRYQVEALQAAKAEVCGLGRMLFCDADTRQLYLYRYQGPEDSWIAGGSLLYTREFWRRAPFPDAQVGSDTVFILRRKLDRAVFLEDLRFYVALKHSGNTSQKDLAQPPWSLWNDASLDELVGEPDSFLCPPEPPRPKPPTFSIVQAVHNARAMTQISTLRTLRHSAGQDARLVIVDNASTGQHEDGALDWIKVLESRGDIDLIRNRTNVGHGPALEQGVRHTESPYVVTLDSDAFPISNEWLSNLRARLTDGVKIAGIPHHRDYIHPSCLMIERQTIEEFGLSFLNEKDQTSRFDVAERISHEVRRRGFQTLALARTSSQRRGSVSEPVDLGAEYEGLVRHQWYTTRFVLAKDKRVDDVPPEAVEQSLKELFDSWQAEPRELTVVVGLRAGPLDQERRRNARACLLALNLQTLERWRYRIVLVEQDRSSQLASSMSALVDRYVFAYNRGSYNRGWAFNVGANGATGALLLIDGDLLVPPDFLRRGLEELQNAKAILPYTEVLYLDGPSTRAAMADRLLAPMHRRTTADYTGQLSPTSVGGAIWVDASLYQEIGGHDERFRGWGREDREFYQRLEQATAVIRWPDRLLHLHHPRPPMNDAGARANCELYSRIESNPEPRTVTIGNVNLYAAEAPSKRDWEGWHDWDTVRIGRILDEESKLRSHTGGRWELAQIVMRLGDSLLDVGCGPGALWPHLRRCGRYSTCIGLDVAQVMLSVARRHFPNVPVVRGDASDLPFRSQSVDVVLLRHVFEHVPQWLMENALAEAIRIARRAVVIAFYMPPANGHQAPTSKRAGVFLINRWTVEQVLAPVQGLGWNVRPPVLIDEGKEQAWIAHPRRRANVPVLINVTSGQPKFSIVLPTFRRPLGLWQTIERVCAQTYSNWELIIIDNAGDVSEEITDSRIRVYRHTERASAGYARNCGAQRATGDFVCFFDDDDDMFPNYLERLAAAFREHPRANMVRSGIVLFDGRVIFSYATPQNCIRRQFATPTWDSAGAGQDRRYYSRLIDEHRWTEEDGSIYVLREALCRANADRKGGLREGHY